MKYRRAMYRLSQCGVVVNTVLIFVNLSMSNVEWALFNFLTALLCWPGIFLNSDAYDEE